jgi:hypothetical protein
MKARSVLLGRTKAKLVFSNTRLFISDLRSHLGPEIIEALECTQVDTSRTLDGDDEGKNGRHISQSNAFIQSIQFIDQKNFVNSVLSPKTNLTDYLEPCDDVQGGLARHKKAHFRYQ